MSKALLAGTFDPPTKGHEFLLDYASQRYDSVIIAIFQNVEKQNLFSKEARLSFLKILAQKYPNVTVDISDGYTIDYALSHQITVLVRGYRNDEDYQYEKIVENYNLTHGGIPTDLVLTPESLKEVSSTVVRSLLETKKDISRLVPEDLILPIQNEYQK